MAAVFEKTKTPGIYRRGTSYVVKVRDRRGRQIARSAETIAEAKDLQAKLRADIARGEFRTQTRSGFASYAAEWIRTYTGRTSRGFKEQTRLDYQRSLEKHAIPYFRQLQLAKIEPQDIKAYARHLGEKRIFADTDRERGLSADSIRLAMAPVKALLATAFEDGLIRAQTLPPTYE